MGILYLALPIPSRVRDQLADSIDSTQAAHPRLDWKKPFNWHITLAVFAGDTPVDDVASGTSEALSRVGVGGPVAVDGVGHWARPGVLWANITGADTWAGLAEECRALQAQLSPDSWSPDSWNAHMSLAAKISLADAPALLDALAHLRSTPWTPEWVELRRSGVGQRHRLEARLL